MLTRLLVFLIGIYQTYVSPLRPRTCKYYPTCSEYARQALLIHGPFMGLLLASWRILRCNPFSYGGYDPVPPKRMQLTEAKEVR
ncbi:MAG: membrane protein insertion efficiency factor YidD [Bacillota bacterium]